MVVVFHEAAFVEHPVAMLPSAAADGPSDNAGRAIRGRAASDCALMCEPNMGEEESMRFTWRGFVGTVLVPTTVVVLSGSALAQYVYPTRGQSPQQQQQDQGQCQQWAMQQTGPPPPPPSSGGGQVGRTAARGAAVGAVGGAIGGDAGKGAAAGAAAGALVGGMRRRDERRQAEAVQTQASDNYARAFAACLEGRGYTVK